MGKASLQEPIHILGGGLAGSEAAWQLAQRGLHVRLYEMRPEKSTPAHKTARLAELVCSNSLKSDAENTAAWLLKEELRRMGSLLMAVACEVRVPAGNALTVDRDLFAAEVTETLSGQPGIEIVRREATEIPSEGTVIVATGPLTSDALADRIIRLSGREKLYFYDSISPIVDAETVNTEVAFAASRYGKSLDGTGDYLNCPLTGEEYDRFVDALLEARRHTPHIPDDIPYFEACLPIEELARRGRDTLRFGPMKPVGLVDPRSAKRPYAAVQLRRENARASSYNLVGFQNYLQYAEQARILRMIPGLEKAEFLRYGQIHRNTYINAPALLNDCLQLRSESRILFAGQISGVEGYVESIATGLAAGLHATALAAGRAPRPFPRASAIGSLCTYISGADPSNYQPANLTFDLLPPLEEAFPKGRERKARHAEMCRRALAALEEYREVTSPARPEFGACSRTT